MSSLDFTETRKLLEGDDTFAFTLMTILLSQYGDETFTEEPIVLFRNLEEDFNCKLSDENENRINAAITTVTTDLAYHNPNVFKAVALALTEGDIGGIPDGDDEELEGSAALWAITEISLLKGTSGGDDAFDLYDAKIHKLVGAALAEQAEELDEVDDSVDTIQEAMREEYFVKRIREDLVELALQLKAIGMDEKVIKELLASQGLTL